MSQQPHPGHRLTRTERTSPHGTPQNIIRTPTGGQNAVPASDGRHSGPHRSEGRHLQPRESTRKPFARRGKPGADPAFPVTWPQGTRRAHRDRQGLRVDVSRGRVLW